MGWTRKYIFDPALKASSPVESNSPNVPPPFGSRTCSQRVNVRSGPAFGVAEGDCRVVGVSCGVVLKVRHARTPIDPTINTAAAYSNRLCELSHDVGAGEGWGYTTTGFPPSSRSSLPIFSKVLSSGLIF